MKVAGVFGNIISRDIGATTTVINPIKFKEEI
jgi:hypothetical protein